MKVWSGCHGNQWRLPGAMKWSTSSRAGRTEQENLSLSTSKISSPSLPQFHSHLSISSGVS